MNETADLLQIRIEKAKNQLPKEAREAIDAVDWRGVVLGMKDKKGYSIEQLENLELETELLLAGLVNPENYPKELEGRMKIPRAKIDELVNEMNELVFKKIREELMKNAAKDKMLSAVPNRPGEASAMSTLGRPAYSEIEAPAPLQVKINVSETQMQKNDTQILSNAGIQIVAEKEEIKPKMEAPLEKAEEIIAKIEKPELINREVELKKALPSILSSKLSGSFQIPSVKTEHSSLPLQGGSGISKVTPSSTQAPSQSPVVKKEDPYRLSPEE